MLYDVYYPPGVVERNIFLSEAMKTPNAIAVNERDDEYLRYDYKSKEWVHMNKEEALSEIDKMKEFAGKTWLF